MGLPREVLPGRSYMMTRRCTQRQFLLRPDPEMTAAFLYCLAEAALRFGIEVLFTMANANHHHTGIYDRYGNYPAFLEHFHKLVAKCGNALRGRWENFWSAEQTSVVRLVDPDDILAKMVYALGNPVKDHLVERAHHWPGASSLRATLAGDTLTLRRPRCFFRSEGPMPETVTLRFAPLPGFEHMSQAEFGRLLEGRIREVETTAAQERRRTGARILGRAAVLAQRWRDRPQTAEPRRGLSPRVAARNKWSRLEAILRNKAFVDAYRVARDALVHGVRDVLFPAGTYWLRRFADVCCEPLAAPGTS